MSKKKKMKHNGFASNARNSTKGSGKDILNRQAPVKKYLNDVTIENLVGSNDLAKIILNAPIEDVLKNGLKISVLKSDGTEDIENTKKLLNKLDELDYLEKIMEFMEKVRKFGYAVMYLNAFHNEEKETSDELGEKYHIKGLSVFDKTEIVKIKVENSKLKLNYGEVTELQVKNYSNNGYYNQSVKTEIHPSRVIFSRINEHKRLIGESIFTSLFDRMVILDSTEWSIGQLIYRAVFLIYKTDVNTMDKIKESGGVRDKEEEINASTLAVIGKDDEMQVINSTGGIDPEKYINAVLTILSIHTNIPKQRLAGNTQGTLAGSEEDAKKYAEYLRRYFNKNILPITNNLIDKVLIELKIDQRYKVELPNLLEPTVAEQIDNDLKRVELDTKKLEYLEKALNIVSNNELIEKKDKIAEIIKKLGEEDFDFEALLKELS
ncbi:phage-associated protein, HI1409 family [Leptotrichia sp. oral taxon 215 str. W9775]|uniref:anti-CBASS protein Acb1 family protein n=1 Tax=Leptotrichia sp. oral taxon 215 TaxID=712359 RepID=UPI0003ADC63F|nr:anti-CBASS Acb1 family protein [Leptotrichia sp. oral taxon 215]ERK69057.1 phage-associated protein, HI1409 family [Leptotrichia sp. oral taxon 215 str. W9775]DAF18507.1 MAG TPA: portal [Caudoviricetes sp.]